MKKIIFILLWLTGSFLTASAQDVPPVNPIAVSPNFTWYKKIVAGDTSFYGYSNNNWVNFARSYWVKKVLRDSLASHLKINSYNHGNFLLDSLYAIVLGNQTYIQSGILNLGNTRVSGSETNSLLNMNGLQISSNIIASRIAIIGRNGLNIIGKNGTIIVSFNDNNQDADNPYIYFKYGFFLDHSIPLYEDSDNSVLVQDNRIGQHGVMRRVPFTYFAVDAVKANLLGGNIFYGTQTISSGNLGLSNGYLQTTDAGGTGRIGRFFGSVLSDIGTTNNLNLGTGTLSNSVSLTANDKVLISSYLSGTPSAIIFAGPTITRSTDGAKSIFATDTVGFVKGNVFHRDPSVFESGSIKASGALNTQTGLVVYDNNGEYDAYSRRSIMFGGSSTSGNPFPTIISPNNANSGGGIDLILPNHSGTVQLTNDNTTYNQVNNIPANSLIGNNTNSIASAVAVPYYDSGELTYTDAITWTGTAAPAGTPTNTYQWTQIGKMVTIRVTLLYPTAGTSVTSVLCDIPTGLPPVHTPSGFSSGFYYHGWGGMSSDTGTLPSSSSTVVLVNSGGVNRFRCSYSTGSDFKVAYLNFVYWTD